MIEEILKSLSDIELADINKQQELEEEVECNMCGNIMSLLEDESIYVCFNSECTHCYEEYNEEPEK